MLRQPVKATCSNDDECQPGLSCLCDDYKDYVRARRRALLFGNLPQPPIKYKVAAGASDKAVAGAWSYRAGKVKASPNTSRTALPNYVENLIFSFIRGLHPRPTKQYTRHTHTHTMRTMKRMRARQQMEPEPVRAPAQSARACS